MTQPPANSQRAWLDTLLHIADSPTRTAAAYAIGVLFGFSPFLGLHTALALAFAFFLNLNRVAVLLGVYSNLPWIIAPWYAATTALGAALLRTRMPPEFGERLGKLFAEDSLFHASFWHGLTALVSPLLWPFLVGSTLGAVVLSLVAYRIALAFVNARRKHVPLGWVHRAHGPEERDEPKTS
jgi:uncharacterized protein (DUF2062 family)